MKKLLSKHWCSGFIIFGIVLLICCAYVKKCDMEKTYTRALHSREDRIRQLEARDSSVANIARVLGVAYGMSVPEQRINAAMLYEFCREFNMDTLWQLPAGVLWIETQYQTRLTSDKDCKGRAQFKEKTIQELANKYNIKYVEDETVWNNVNATYLCIAYLAEGLKGKDINNAARYYFAGPRHKRNKKNNVVKYSSAVLREYAYLRMLSGN